MPRRWAALLFPAPNSDVVAISLAIVFRTTEVFSPVVRFFFADFFAFLAFSKKYLTFFLLIMSNKVPIITRATIAITKICIAIGGTNSAS